MYSLLFAGLLATQYLSTIASMESNRSPMYSRRTTLFDSSLQPTLIRNQPLDSGASQFNWFVEVSASSHFISGSGSGMEALIRHQMSGPCLHQTTLVVSNLASATGLQKTGAYGIATVITEVDTSIPNPSERRREHERRLLSILQSTQHRGCHPIWIRTSLSPHFVAPWKGRLMNITLPCCRIIRGPMPIGCTGRRSLRNRVHCPFR